MKSRLFVVRHGNTFETGQTPLRIGRRCDPSLTAEGRTQASALADMFLRQGVVFGAILTGSLSRTIETAEIIRTAMANPITPVAADWLTEIDHGPDEGKPDELVLARIGSAALAAWEEAGIPPPGWLVDVDKRRCAWRKLIEGRPEGDTLLVTSNGAARFALLALPSYDGYSLKLRTGTYGLIDACTAQPVRWNRRPGEGGD